MPIHIVAADDQPALPWKNEGGMTRELLRWPAEGNWRLRISLADITSDGPFSAFPGVKRWFAVVQGGGLRLQLPDGEKRLVAGAAPLVFDGELEPDCQLLAGPTRDLNLMLEGAAGGMALAQQGAPWVTPNALRAIFCAAPSILRVDDRTTQAVPAMGLAWSAHAGDEHWQLESNNGLAWWIWVDVDVDLR